MNRRTGTALALAVLALVPVIAPMSSAQGGPHVEIHADPAEPGGDGGWYLDPVGVKLQADGDAPLRVEYRLDGGPWLPYGGVIMMPDGQTEVLARVTDTHGRDDVDLRTFRVDTTPPGVRLETREGAPVPTWSRSALPVALHAQDLASGIRDVQYRTGSGPWTAWDGGGLGTFGDGVHNIWLQATDQAGNALPVERHEIRVDTHPPVPAPAEWSYDPSTWLVEAQWKGDHYDAVSGIASVRVETAEGGAWTEPPVLYPTDGGDGLRIPVTPGTHVLRLVVTDRAGNEAATPPQEVEAVQARAGGLLHPARGEVTLVPADALADPVQRIDVFVDGVFATSARGAGVVWDTRQVDDGVHTVTLVTVLDDGTTEADTVRFQVRNAYALVLVDHILPLLLAPAALAAVAAATILRARAGAPVGRHGWVLALGALAASAGALSILLLRSTRVIVTGEILVAAAVLAGGIAYVRWVLTVPEPEPEEPEKRRPDRPLDFDRAWRGGGGAP